MKGLGLWVFLFAVSAGLAIGGCGSASDAPGGSGGFGGEGAASGTSQKTGTLALLFTDNPTDDFAKVFVTVKSIELLSEDEGEDDDNEKVKIFEGSRRIDLLSLEEVEDLFMLDDAVPVGTYTKIRLRVEDPQFVKKDGTEIKADEIKLVAKGKIDLIPKTPIRIVSGAALVVRIDFDAKKSIHIHAASSKYQLRPVIFVTVLSDFEQRLLSVKGRIESLRPDDRSFLLKRTRHPFAHMDDDEAERPYRIRVFVMDGTRIFDASGDPAGFDALAVDQFVQVKGLLSREPVLSLKARLIEIGHPIRLLGTIQKGVEVFGDNEDGRFVFVPDAGQGIEGEMTVFFHDDTLLLKGGTHAPAEPSDLTTGKQVIIKGVINISATVVQFKASVIVIKGEGNLQEKLEGVVSEINRNRRMFKLIRETGGPLWVHVPAEAFILRIHEEEDDSALQAERVDFDGLENGQTVVLFGKALQAAFEGDPAFEAAVVLIDAKPKGFMTLVQGVSSGITTQRLEAIDNQADWDAFWGAHSGGSVAPPQVDFNLKVLLVAHLGNRPTSGYQVEITQVEDAGGNLAVHYTETVPGASCLVNPILTQPHHIVSVPKTSSLLQFNETSVVTSCF